MNEEFGGKGVPWLYLSKGSGRLMATRECLCTSCVYQVSFLRAKYFKITFWKKVIENRM